MVVNEYPQRSTGAVSAAPIWGRWGAVAVSALGAFVLDAFTAAPPCRWSRAFDEGAILDDHPRTLSR